MAGRRSKARRNTTGRTPAAQATRPKPGLAPWAIASAILAALLWSFWPVIASLMRDWKNDPNYSIGQLVPFAALYLLWQEREALRRDGGSPCWWGLALLLPAAAARLFGLLFLFESAERYALVLTIAGLTLLVAGRIAFWRVRWILLFLLLMVPLPGRIHNLISGPLQTYATVSTVFVLELAGAVVSRDGNVMVLNDDTPLAVAEACSGLRMLTAFIVVAVVLAYIANRPRWQKTILVVSSVPVAIVCNVARLAVTAVLYMTTSSATAESFFHDFYGVSMMPLAILILVGELWLLNKLVLPEKEERRHSGDRNGGQPHRSARDKLSAASAARAEAGR